MPSARRLRRAHRARLAVPALLVAGALALGACSSSSPRQDEFVDALERSGLSKDEASCAADAVFDSLSDEQVQAIIDSGASAVPADDPARDDDAMDELRAALTACREDAAATSSTTEAQGTTTTVPTATTAPGVSTTRSSFESTTTAVASTTTP